MPSPEELGIRRASAPVVAETSVDWNDTRDRLARLGALSFRLDKLPQGNCRVTFLLPTRQPQRTHEIEAMAATEAAAVRLALAQAQRWVEQGSP
jgi:hypothetical protein